MTFAASISQAYRDFSMVISTTAIGLESVGLSQQEMDSADNIHIRVYDAPIRYNYDGTSVTPTSGHRIATDGELVLNGNRNIQNLSMIREGGADATLWITLSTYSLLSVNRYGSLIQSYSPVVFYDTSVSTLWQEETRTTQATSNNTSVGALDDLSGNDYHVTQSTAASRPILKTNAINGYRTLKFDGIDDFLNNTSFTDFGDDVTVIMVSKYSSAGDNSQGGFEVSNGTLNTGFNLLSGSSSRRQFQAVDSVGVKEVQTINSQLNNMWRIHFMQVDGNVGQIRYFLNGVFQESASYISPNPNTLNQIDVGRIIFAGWNFNGELATLIIFNRVLSNASRIKIENILNQRYNIF